MSWTVYEIVCLVNGKSYVGITSKSVAARWKQHCGPRSNCTFLRNAIQKHGPEQFEVNALVLVASLNEAHELEKYLISCFTPREIYNVNAGGRGAGPRLVCLAGKHSGVEKGDGACRACRNEYKREWAEQNPSGVKAMQQRADQKRDTTPERKRKRHFTYVKNTLKWAVQDFSMQKVFRG